MKRPGPLRLLVLSSLVTLALLPCRAPAQAARPPKAHDTIEVTQLDLSFDVTEGRPGARVTLTARLRDASGRARDAALRVEVDAGTVDAPVRVAAGIYAARVTLPTLLGVRRSLLVFASAGQAVASSALPLAPGPVASLRVEAPDDLPADGAGHPLWIGVTDAHGNPAVEPPRVTVKRGSLAEPVPVGAGEWMVEYVPPRTTWFVDDVVTVRAGEASATQALRLTPISARLTVSPRVGLVLGAGGGAALALSADAALWAATGAPRLGLVLGVSWWGARDSSTVPLPGGAADFRSDRSWLPVTLSVAARQPLGARGTLTLTLGGGGALVSSKADLAGQPGISESRWAPAAAAGLELAFRTRFGAPFLEVRGFWLGDPRLDTVRGAAWPVMFLLGSRFDAY